MNLKKIGTYAILASALNATEAQISEVSIEHNEAQRSVLEEQKWDERYQIFSTFVEKICCLMNQKIPNISAITQGVIHVNPNHYESFVFELRNFLSNNNHNEMLIDEKINLVQNMGKLKHSDYRRFLFFINQLLTACQLSLDISVKAGVDLSPEKYVSIYHTLLRLSPHDSSLEERIAILNALTLLK